jgi:hypothetical protein
MQSLYRVWAATCANGGVVGGGGMVEGLSGGEAEPTGVVHTGSDLSGTVGVGASTLMD